MWRSRVLQHLLYSNIVYLCKSVRGKQFRQWTNKVLKETAKKVKTIAAYRRMMQAHKMLRLST